MVTVVIPTYNRAHLLPKVVPSYIQEGVSKIILVDDASSDNTTQIINELKKQIPIIEYIRLQQNSKQTVAKNIGIDNTDTKWIYFGDDDSILIPNSIQVLLNTCQDYNAGICGAKALYLESDDDLKNVDAFIKRMDVPPPVNKKIADLDILEGNLIYSFDNPVEVAYVQAAALVKTCIAKTIKFDTLYTGNCYREETDFFLRANLAGAKIMYNSKAVQVNLPRKMATGGSHSSNKLRWYYYTLCNNHRFIKKNWENIRRKYKETSPSYVVEFRFITKIIFSGTSNFIKNKIKIK